MEIADVITNKILGGMEVSPWDTNIDVFVSYCMEREEIPESDLAKVRDAVLKKIESVLVKAVRLRLGFGPKELAQEIGVTRRQVHLWESGKRPPLKQTRLALECLLRRAGKCVETPHLLKKIGKKHYFWEDKVDWGDAIEAGGFYFERAQYLGLPHPLAMIVCEEAFPGIRKSDVLEARGVYHELFKNAEADLAAELMEANELEEVPGHG